MHRAPLLLFAVVCLAAPAYSQCQHMVVNPVTHQRDCNDSALTGPNATATSVGAVTSLTVTHNLNTLNIVPFCYTTDTGLPVTITSITGQTVNAVTLNFASTANIKCDVNGTGGIGQTGSTGATGAAGPQGPAGSMQTPYTQAVVAQTTVTITQATHTQGTLAIATCFDNAGTPVAVNCNYSRNGSGDMTFTFSPAFTGTIQIFGGSGTGSGAILAGDVTGPVGANTVAVGAVTDAKASLLNKPSVGLVGTSNLALSGAQTIDSVLGTAGTTIVLATAQTAPAENGPWVMQSGAWTRPTWYPSGGTTQALQFSTTLVRLGTVNSGTTWRMTTSGAITIDTTGTTWAITPYTLGPTTVTGTLPAAQVPASIRIRSFAANFDGNGSSLLANAVSVPATIKAGAGTITDWSLCVDQGTATVKVWKIASGTAIPTVANVINTSGLSISSGTCVDSSTVSDFTSLTITANDKFIVTITAIAGGATKLNLTVGYTL